MGEVYRAEEVELGRTVALKLLPRQLAEDQRFRDRFLRESRLAAGLNHPHIIPVYRAGEADGVLFIAMHYVDGTDLRRLLKQHPEGFDPDRALTILEQVADALDAAHTAGLIHRDVKPGNVLIVEGGRRDHSTRLWALFMLELWHRAFVDDGGAAALARAEEAGAVAV